MLKYFVMTSNMIYVLRVWLFQFSRTSLYIFLFSTLFLPLPCRAVDPATIAVGASAAEKVLSGIPKSYRFIKTELNKAKKGSIITGVKIELLGSNAAFLDLKIKCGHRLKSFPWYVKSLTVSAFERQVGKKNYDNDHAKRQRAVQFHIKSIMRLKRVQLALEGGLKETAVDLHIEGKCRRYRKGKFRGKDKVTVNAYRRLIVDLTPYYNPPPSPKQQPQQPRFSGLFKKSSGRPSIFISDKTADQMRQEQTKQNRRGYYLIELESYLNDSNLLFSGVFKQGRESTIAIINKSETDFFPQLKKLERKGYRLIDIEAWSQNNQIRWAGIVTELKYTFPTFLVISKKWDTFESIRDQQRTNGFSLYDFEIVKVGKSRWYLGIFKKNGIKSLLRYNYSWDNFRSYMAGYTDKGFKLTDLEINYHNNKRRFSGVFRKLKKKHTHRMNETKKGFKNLIKKLKEDGYYLIDLEVDVGR